MAEAHTVHSFIHSWPDCAYGRPLAKRGPFLHNGVFQQILHGRLGIGHAAQPPDLLHVSYNRFGFTMPRSNNLDDFASGQIEPQGYLLTT